MFSLPSDIIPLVYSNLSIRDLTDSSRVNKHSHECFIEIKKKLKIPCRIAVALSFIDHTTIAHIHILIGNSSDIPRFDFGLFHWGNYIEVDVTHNF